MQNSDESLRNQTVAPPNGFRVKNQSLFVLRTASSSLEQSLRPQNNRTGLPPAGSLVQPDMSDHLLLKNLPQSLFYLLKEDLRDPSTQGVDRVQELRLDGVEQRVEHIVLKGKLQEQKQSCWFGSDWIWGRSLLRQPLTSRMAS